MSSHKKILTTWMEYLIVNYKFMVEEETSATSQAMWVLVWDFWFLLISVRSLCMYVAGCSQVCVSWVLSTDGTFLWYLDLAFYIFERCHTIDQSCVLQFYHNMINQNFTNLGIIMFGWAYFD